MLTGQLLLQLIVILIVVQLAGYLCQRLGQQWVVGEILAGLALGPSLLGALFPHAENLLFPATSLPVLQTLGDIGLVLYMFSLGAQLDVHLILRQCRTAIVTSVSGIILPLSLGAVLAFFLFPGLAGPKASLITFLLLVGTAMAITAFPVLARLLSEKKLLETRVGTLALTCAAIDDVVAWCLLALVTALIRSQGLPSVVVTIGMTLLFVVCMFFIVKPLLAYADRRIISNQIKIALCFVLLLSCAYYTNAIGIHPIFGAFVMGIILPRRVHFVELVRNISHVNNMLFLPLFFVYSGLHTQVGLINSPVMWLICLLILVTACVSKMAGGTFAVRSMGESWRDAFSLGILMNTRGLVELIVLNIGLELGVLSPTLFASLVIMALVTTMMASPLLSLPILRQGRKQEIADPAPKVLAMQDQHG